jgi:hypothetical protein
MQAGWSKRPKNNGVTIDCHGYINHTNPFCHIQKIFLISEQPSLSSDSNTIMSLPCYIREIVCFFVKHSPSSLLIDVYRIQWGNFRQKSCSHSQGQELEIIEHKCENKRQDENFFANPPTNDYGTNFAFAIHRWKPDWAGVDPDPNMIEELNASKLGFRLCHVTACRQMEKRNLFKSIM